MGLKEVKILLPVGVVRKDRSTGRCLRVSEGILGVLLFPKGRVIVLVLRDQQNSDDINKWDTHHAMYTGQKFLHLVKDLHVRGSVKVQGYIFRLLVLGSPIVLVTLLLSQKAYPTLKFHLHKWLQGCTHLS
jgi:hypothetical protein